MKYGMMFGLLLLILLSSCASTSVAVSAGDPDVTEGKPKPAFSTSLVPGGAVQAKVHIDEAREAGDLFCIKGSFVTIFRYGKSAPFVQKGEGLTGWVQKKEIASWDKGSDLVKAGQKVMVTVKFEKNPPPDANECKWRVLRIW